MIARIRRLIAGRILKTTRWVEKTFFGLGDVNIMVDRYWDDERHRAAEGWLAADEPIDGVELKVGSDWAPSETLVPRKDIAEDLGKPLEATKGFQFHVAHGNPMDLDMRVRRKGHWTRHRVRLQPPDNAEKPDVPDGGALFAQFAKEVNERHLNVLEIGSRIVSPGSVSKRSLFPGAASYTGFDYYPDANTDITGDAHKLSGLVGDRRFDAVFSIAVFEHLAMPWVVAKEINHILNPGGITYHGTVFAWPTHERPWDFWRLSDEGLKVLFSPALGFEVLGAGMFDPVSMHFRNLRSGYEGFPHAAAYASAAILARKKTGTDTDAFRWPSDLSSYVGTDSHYPNK